MSDLDHTRWQESRLPSFEEVGNDPENPETVQKIITGRWEDLRPARLSWERTVEENVRMLSGRQYEVFIESMGQFQDLREYFLPDEDRWRRYPVFNWLSHYYRLAIAKLTENMPQIGGMPAQSDLASMQLAELWDYLWKFEWDQMELGEQYGLLRGWQLLAGRSIVRLRWDPTRGPVEDFQGSLPPGSLVMANGQPYQRPLVAPFRLAEGPDGAEGEDFEPAIDGWEHGSPVLGQAYRHRLGDLLAEVLNPLSCITPWDGRPFWRKPWYTLHYRVSCEEAYQRWGVELEPDGETESDLLYRLDYGSFFGAKGDSGQVAEGTLAETVGIWEHWQRDVPNDPDLHAGRTTVVCRTRTLWDDANPYVEEGLQERAIIPIYAFDLTSYPFRQEGTTDLENLVHIARSINRRMGGLQDAAELNEQPITLVNDDAELEEGNDWNQPGGEYRYSAASAGNRPPIEYLTPPGLPQGSVEMVGMLMEWMMRLGYVNPGSEGHPVTQDASGELQRQARFDMDRPWGEVIRRDSFTWCRMGGDIVDILAVTWPDERIISVVGEENAVKFLTLRKDMFRGRVMFRAAPESQVLETRQDRQNRMTQAFGVAAKLPPELGQLYLQLLNEPDLHRLTRPGGDAYTRVQREHLEITLGMYPPVLPEHDHAFDLQQHKAYCQTLEFRNWPPQLQGLMRAHILAHEIAQDAALVEQTSRAVDQAQARTRLMLPAMRGAQDAGAGPTDERAGADPAGAPSAGRPSLTLAG